MSCRPTSSTSHLNRSGRLCQRLDEVPWTGSRSNHVVLHSDTKQTVGLPFLISQRHWSNTMSRGKTRLAKWYVPYSDDEKIKLKGEVRKGATLPPSPGRPPGCPSMRKQRLTPSPGGDRCTDS